MGRPTPERWARVQRLLDRALELPPASHTAFLDGACAGDAELRDEVEHLLRACAQADRFLEEPAASLAGPLLAEMMPPGGAPAPGARIGPYRVLREIGTGGMGSVCLAERDDDQFGMRVALKLVRWSFDARMVRRFVEERQILATLDHPNIARLLDGGVTDEGSPWFAMEYVDGMPIDRYCRAHRLPLEARLELFREVCGTVHYAHRNLVVHRDLKPANILVTADGTVKLLDFGIAKLLGRDAAPGSPALTWTEPRPMTPEYASPEQVRGGAISTASDVYALGVLLYRLLTGHSPYRCTDRRPYEVARSILEEEPERPSAAVARRQPPVGADPPGTGPDAASPADESAVEGVATPAGAGAAESDPASGAGALPPAALRRQLRGDLDTIVLKALQKEPERRYTSAERFGEDVRRYLTGLPVLARRDTVAYRASKFARRHRVGVAAAALVALSLTGGIAGTAWQARAAAAERDRARIEAAKAAQVSRFLVGLFEASDPGEAGGEEITARELLDRGAARTEALADQPEAQATLMTVMGKVYRNLGSYDRAGPLLERAAAARRSLAGTADTDVAETLHELARLRFETGDVEAAERIFREALALRLGLDDRDSPELAETRHELARVLSDRGDYAAAEPLYRDALDMSRRLYGTDHPETATGLNDLAKLERDRGNYTRAESLARASLATWRKLHGDAHPETAIAKQTLAGILAGGRSYAEAERLYRDVLAFERRSLGDRHVRVAVTLLQLGAVLRDRGEAPAAEPLYREALATNRALYGEEHGLVARALQGLASLRSATGDFAGAEPLYRRALEIRRTLHAEDHWRVAEAKSALGECLTGLRKYGEAERLLVEAQRVLAARRGRADPATRNALVRLIALYDAQGMADAAAEYRRRLPNAEETEPGAEG